MIEVKNRETGYARVNGANLHYSIVGEGHPLVLVHAGIADSRMWGRQVEALCQRYQVITYDMRGFGKTDMPPGEFAHHRDLFGLLEYLVVTKAYLLGSSMGGSVAINCTLDFQEYIDGLILVDPAVEGYTFRDGVTREHWADVDRALENGNYELAAELEIKMWVAGPNRSLDDVHPEIRHLVHDMLIPTYRIPCDRGLEQQLERPAIDHLNDIRVPTLVIVGDQDVPDFLKISDLIIKTVPAADKYVIPGAAHLPNMEKPEVFNKAVFDFLSHRRF